MSKTAKTSTPAVRFEMRLSPADAQRLDAISARLHLSKSDVLRLALDPDFGRESTTLSHEVGVINESLDALNARLKNIEALLDSALDLLLVVSRNSAPEAQPATSPDQSAKPANSASPSAPTWQAWLAKNPKLNPVMPESKWHDFLRARYEKEFGIPPVVS